jgi:NADH dehydrogenase
MAAARKRVIILGGGFGGVYTAMNLSKMIKGSDDLEALLVNKENYMVFQPLLPEVISGSIDLLHCITPIRRLCPDVRLVTREIEEINPQKKIIITGFGVRPEPLKISYDYLVIALGTFNDFSSLPGLKEHALPFKNMADALTLRNRLIHTLEEAELETNPEVRRSLLTFVVAGGGFSGVEVAAEMNDFMQLAKRHYPGLRKEEISVVLIHSGEGILPELTEKLGLYAQRILQKRNVKILLNERVAKATAGSVYLKSGKKILSRTLISTVPSSPNPLISSLECKKIKGRIVTDEFLAARGMENVWAVGDCAYILRKDGTPSPPTAQFAVRQAAVIAQNIMVTHRESGEKKNFDFTGLGKTGSLGRHSAVAEVMGINISGFLAWFFWRSLYWAKMPGLDRKIRVGLDWALNLILPRELVQLKISPSESFSVEHFEADEFIFRQGDIGDKMYVIARGEVEILLEKDSKEQRLAALSKDQYFGEMALFSGDPRMASAHTVSPVDLIVIRQGEFEMLVKHFPAIYQIFKKEIDRRREENRQRELASSGGK